MIMGGIVIGIAALFAALLLLAKKTEGGTFVDYSTGEVVKPKEPILTTVDGMISYVSGKHGVPAALIKAVAMTESSLNPNATNPSDPSYGLMGIMPILAEDYGIVKDWHNATEAEIAMIKDPLTNLNIGAWHLSRLLKQYPFDDSIQMYNVGVSGFKSGRRNAEYLSRVKRYYNEYGNDTIR